MFIRDKKDDSILQFGMLFKIKQRFKQVEFQIEKYSSDSAEKYQKSKKHGSNILANRSDLYRHLGKLVVEYAHRIADIFRSELICSRNSPYKASEIIELRYPGLYDQMMDKYSRKNIFRLNRK